MSVSYIFDTRFSYHISDKQDLHIWFATVENCSVAIGLIYAFGDLLCTVIYFWDNLVIISWSRWFHSQTWLCFNSQIFHIINWSLGYLSSCAKSEWANLIFSYFSIKHTYTKRSCTPTEKFKSIEEMQYSNC